MTKARDLANIISGGFDATDIPNLDTAKITSGTFADARLPSTALNSNVDLTTLSASNLTSGTLADARFPATLPAISGASLTNLPASGITNVDKWKLSDGSYSDGAVMNGTWSRVTTLNGLPHGTGLTVSSGVFTFPQTGLYKIDFGCYIYQSYVVSYTGPKIQGTSDGFSSNEQDLSLSYGAIPVNGMHSNIHHSAIYEITNTSNNKVRIKLSASGSCGYYQTKLIFTRLADV
jgi:hypothetical protein